MRTGIKVGDAMTTRPITTSKNTSIQECAKLMKKFDVGSVLVQDNNQVIGIVTEFDLARKVIVNTMDYDDPIKKIMEKILVTVSPNNDLLEAMELMRKHDIRHLPVQDNNKFTGLITMKDILKIEPQLFELVADNIRLREESRKPLNDSNDEGICESCGNYSENLDDFEGSKICTECKS